MRNVIFQGQQYEELTSYGPFFCLQTHLYFEVSMFNNSISTWNIVYVIQVINFIISF